LGIVVKLREDIDAVVAAMVLPYSQGQTEGKVTNLNLIKRLMYERETIYLLRQRVLYTAAN
jgi:transposase